MDKLLFGRRVLVVEDEMLTLMMIEDMLADLGCESVTAAATTDQAVALIDRQVFDAAMVDVNLNGTDSYTVAHALAVRGVPFVFCTGSIAVVPLRAARIVSGGLFRGKVALPFSPVRPADSVAPRDAHPFNGRTHNTGASRPEDGRRRLSRRTATVCSIRKPTWRQVMTSISSSEAAKAVVRRNTEEVQGGGNFEAFDELFADNFFDHTPQPGRTPDKEGARQLYKILRTAFPDFHADIHWQLADGDRVTTYKTYHGTHRGEFLGVAPTGRKIQFETVDVMRVRNGKIVEHWGVANLFSLMQQLGAWPAKQGRS